MFSSYLNTMSSLQYTVTNSMHGGALPVSSGTVRCAACHPAGAVSMPGTARCQTSISLKQPGTQGPGCCSTPQRKPISQETATPRQWSGNMSLWPCNLGCFLKTPAPFTKSQNILHPIRISLIFSPSINIGYHVRHQLRRDQFYLCCERKWCKWTYMASRQNFY